MKALHILLLFLCLIGIQSCFFELKNVDIYYTANSWGKLRPRIPLLKPLSIYKDRMTPDIWRVDYKDLVTRQRYKDYYFNHTLGIDSIIDIGVDKSYVYGMIFEKKHRSLIYNEGDYIYALRYGGTGSSEKEITDLRNKIRIFPIDSVNKIFILPKRWFVINIADSTTEAFFSKKKYISYLKEKGISGKMYNIDSINNVFLETGILPWFPKNVKDKLKKK